MKITIRDVAKKTGFSVTTVSLVLNNKKSNISQATRDLILATSEELGYRPNQLAVAMITKKTNVLGLIIPDIANPFFSEIAKQVGLEARRYGYTIFIGETFNDPQKYTDLLQMYVDRQVDGIVVTNSTRLSMEDELNNIETLHRRGIPTISIDSNIDRDDMNSILVDHRLGGYLATKHLIELGHTSIGCMSGPSKVATSEERIEGYKQALLEADIAFDETLIYEGDYSMKQGKDALQHFLNKECTAIFALNDMMAFGIYRAAFKRNLCIPEDLSIVGFDDVNISEIVYPSLTTIRQPIESIAVNSVGVLHYIIENKIPMNQGKRVYLEPSLIIRESTKKRN